MAERDLVDSIGRLLTRRKAWWFKTHGAGTGRSGIPDLVGAYRGRPLALEAKRAGEKPSRLQAFELCRAARAGATTAVVTNISQVTEILDQIDREHATTPKEVSAE